MYAPEAERLGVLHPEQLAMAYERQWFKLLAPAAYSGVEKPLPEMVRLEESLSWADGSLGWVVTLCCGAGWFGGFLNADVAASVFSKPEVCLAGSGAPGGTAVKTTNGYLINGSWKYASGAHHATHITANCLIIENGETVLNDADEPLILPFVFDKKDVTVLPAWKYVGMVATGSDAFSVKNLLVPFDRQFEIDPKALVIDSPLYRYPFLQLAEATLAVNLSGIAIHFMDLCEGVFTQRMKHPRLTDPQKTFLKIELANTENQLNTLREVFYEALDRSWGAITTDGFIADELLAEVSSSSRQLAHAARKLTDRLYPLCGLAAASTDTEINRAWRDLHTASQHSLLTF